MNAHRSRSLHHEDSAVQQEALNVARSVVGVVKQLRPGNLSQSEKCIKDARTK